jgi:two-component system chemotaxis response regulator CheB
MRVLVIDDSLLVRAFVGDVLGKIPGVEICGRAADGQAGLDAILSLKPDLVILDIEMPLMDGITLLGELKTRGVKVPVIMLSTLTQHGARATFQCLELGALDFIPKPTSQSSIPEIEELLREKVTGLLEPAARQPVPTVVQRPHEGKSEILVIGSSTGGPQSLHRIFLGVPGDFPAPILIVQHMPPVFTAAFADRLNQITALNVVEAKDSTTLTAGTVYLGPGNRHMCLRGTKKNATLHLTDDPPVNAHRPSIDYTLNSVVDLFGGAAAALMMTGMGRDGVSAMKRLHDLGGATFAQDEASSVVFGMNRRAIEAGAVDRIVSLDEAWSVMASYF